MPLLKRLARAKLQLGGAEMVGIYALAEGGHDRSGDNLAIRIEDPRFYKCWAECTKEMIRAALGCPIRYRQSA